MEAHEITIGTAVLMPKYLGGRKVKSYFLSRATAIGLPREGMVRVLRDTDKQEFVVPVSDLTLN